MNRNYGDTNFITSLRAIAIILVFLIHSGGAGLRELGAWGNFIVDCGKYGVQVFFVISGFTIFSQLLKEQYSLKKFLLVRISRISLPYYPLLLILFIYIGFGGNQFNGWAIRFNDGIIDIWNLLAHISYLSSYNIHWQNTIIGVEWTLGIEVFFYIIFGLLISYNVVTQTKQSTLILGAASILISGFAVVLVKFYGLDPLFVHWLPFRYFVMFYLGGISYLLRTNYQSYFKDKEQKRKRVSDIYLLFMIAGFVVLAMVPKIQKVTELYFVASTFAIIVLYDISGFLSKYLSIRPLLFLGSISFSFYLVHDIVLSVIPEITDSVFIDFISKLAITCILAFLWYLLFEKILYQKVKIAIKKL